LYVPVILGEIKVEEQLKNIKEKYKNKLENLKINLIKYAIALRNK
jgi:hypothetical protein